MIVLSIVSIDIDLPTEAADQEGEGREVRRERVEGSIDREEMAITSLIEAEIRIEEVEEEEEEEEMERGASLTVLIMLEIVGLLIRGDLDRSSADRVEEEEEEEDARARR